MLNRIRHYLLLALLLAVPVQGLASIVHSVSCAPQGDHAAAVANAETHAGHDHPAAHKHSEDSTKGSGEHAQHQCCHHMSAAPASFDNGATADLPVLQSSVTLLELSFVLEQPQRPPRA